MSKFDKFWSGLFRVLSTVSLVFTFIAISKHAYSLANYQMGWVILTYIWALEIKFNAK